MFRKVFSNIFIYTVFPKLHSIAGIFILPIITKHLTPSDFGIYGVIIAATGALEGLKELGFQVVIANSYFKFKNRYKWIWRQIQGFMVYWGFVFFFLASLIVFIIIPKEAESNTKLIIFLTCSPYLFTPSLDIVSIRYFHYKEKPLQITLRSSILGFIGISIQLYTIVFLKLGYLGWFWSQFFVTILNYISYCYPVIIKGKLLPILNFKWYRIKKSLKLSLPLIPHNYSFYILNSSDRLVMQGLNVGINQIGKYNAAGTLSNYFSQFSDALSFAISPTFMKFYAKGDDISKINYRKLLFILQFGMILITFLTSIWLKEIFIILIKNEELQQAYQIGIILIMSFSYRPMYIAINSLLFFAEKTKSFLKISLVGALINIILNLIFIPYFGILAAALTTYLSLLYVGYSGYFLKEYKQQKQLKVYPEFLIVLTLIITIAAYFLGSMDIHVKLLVTAIISLCLGFFLIKNYKKIIQIKKV
ncbi:oligosaccharide flippase family protein [Flexithrix dorotheae]|uniref:oligosaccharide flippase family protein n=1 Tax=Flexithrix dorotheae TaxID=70993 RepID=UPI00036D6F61|nr:oligosaccharide flippase family protein [Flexithrix dorotheae]